MDVDIEDDYSDMQELLLKECYDTVQELTAAVAAYDDDKVMPHLSPAPVSNAPDTVQTSSQLLKTYIDKRDQSVSSCTDDTVLTNTKLKDFENDNVSREESVDKVSENDMPIIADAAKSSVNKEVADSNSSNDDKAYQVLAIWNEISDSTNDASREVLFDLIAQKLKHDKTSQDGRNQQTETNDFVKTNSDDKDNGSNEKNVEISENKSDNKFKLDDGYVSLKDDTSASALANVKTTVENDEDICKLGTHSEFSKTEPEHNQNPLSVMMDTLEMTEVGESIKENTQTDPKLASLHEVLEWNKDAQTSKINKDIETSVKEESALKPSEVLSATNSITSSIDLKQILTSEENKTLNDNVNKTPSENIDDITKNIACTQPSIMTEIHQTTRINLVNASQAKNSDLPQLESQLNNTIHQSQQQVNTGIKHALVATQNHLQQNTKDVETTGNRQINQSARDIPSAGSQVQSAGDRQTGQNIRDVQPTGSQLQRQNTQYVQSAGSLRAGPADIKAITPAKITTVPVNLDKQVGVCKSNLQNVTVKNEATTNKKITQKPLAGHGQSPGIRQMGVKLNQTNQSLRQNLPTKTQVKPSTTPKKSNQKSTTMGTPNKQTFIDNLIAKGVPIIIPDDDDEVDDNMPGERSPAFKMKSKQYHTDSDVRSPHMKKQQPERAFVSRQEYQYSQQVHYPDEMTATYQEYGVARHQKVHEKEYSNQEYGSGRQITPLYDRECMNQEYGVGRQKVPTPDREYGYSQQLQSQDRDSSHHMYGYGHQAPQSQDYPFTPPKNISTPPRNIKSPPGPIATPPKPRSVSPRNVAYSRGYTPTHTRTIGSPITTPRNMSPRGNLFPPKSPVATRNTNQPSPQGLPKNMSSPIRQSAIVTGTLVRKPQVAIPAQSTKGGSTLSGATIIIDDDLPATQNTQKPAPYRHVIQQLKQHKVSSLQPQYVQRQQLPVIANVTSMAVKESQGLGSEISQPQTPTGLSQPTYPETPTKSISNTQVNTLELQRANERTPVKRSLSDAVQSQRQNMTEPMTKRRNTHGSEINTASNVTDVLAAQQAAPRQQSTDLLPIPTVSSQSGSLFQNPNETSPNKTQPEVVIDIDVDDVDGKDLVAKTITISALDLLSSAAETETNDRIQSPSRSAPEDAATLSSNTMSADSSMSPTTISSPPARGKSGRGGKGGKGPKPRSATTLHKSLKLKCDDCGKECSSKAALKSHRKTHTEDKPFECDVCGKRFTQKCNLKKHIYTHFKDQDKK